MLEENTQKEENIQTPTEDITTQPEPISRELEGSENDTEKSTNQDEKPKKQFPYLNPEGRGGFGDNPQNRSDGRWSKEQSQSYWLNFFNRLPQVEFYSYKDKHPEMTMASLSAWERVKNSIERLAEYQEVTNRTEGKPKESHEITGKDGEPLKTVNENIITFVDYADKE